MAQEWRRNAVGYRIRRGNVVALVAMPYQTGRIASGDILVAYDDGTEDDLYFDPSRTTTSGTTFLSLTNQAAKDGWIVGGFAGLLAPTGTASISLAGFGQVLIVSDVNASRTIACIGSGYTGAFNVIAVGEFADPGFEATWVGQFQITEDATAGTHVCTLTVTPGAGNEMQMRYGRIVVGATATAQTATAFITDGTNDLVDLINGSGASNTTSGAIYQLPQTGQPAATSLFISDAGPVSDFVVSGTMKLVLQVTTAAVSVTQTFAVACRIKGGLPTATLADTVGTPTLTTNTSGVFG